MKSGYYLHIYVWLWDRRWKRLSSNTVIRFSNPNLDNDLFVLLHRVKIETRSEKNSPREVSRLTTGVNHHRSRLSWVCSIEICFLSRLLLTRIVFCLFEIDERYKYKNDSWLTNTTLRSELESRDWKVNHRAVTRNHFLMKAFCLYYGQNHFCSWQPSIFEVISLF